MRSIITLCAQCRAARVPASKPLALFATRICAGSSELRSRVQLQLLASVHRTAAPRSLLQLLPGSDSEQLHAGYGSIRAILRGDIDYLEGAGQRCVCCCCTSAGPRLTRPHLLVCSIHTVTHNAGWSDDGVIT